jgi:signal transduction histidine kinase
LFRFIFEHAPDATLVFDTAARLLLLNRAARKLPPGMTDELFAPRHPFAPELEQLRREAGANGHARTEIHDGKRLFAVDARSHGAHYVVTLHDQSERQALDDEVRSLRRVDSAGHFAVGLAHDVNNLLMPIACLSATLEAELPPGEPERQMAHDIRAAAERASGLARQTLKMVRREATPPAPVDLNAVVTEVRALVERVAGGEVKVELAQAPDTGCARLDRERLEQVILNLVANARDAMPGGGRLTLTTSQVIFDAESASALGAVSGAYVALAVTDTGTGMTREVRERIFERFFTTKATDRGTGLGLDGVRRFVEESGGCIAVHSEPGRGTTIVLYFPRLEEEFTGSFPSP